MAPTPKPQSAHSGLAESAAEASPADMRSARFRVSDGTELHVLEAGPMDASVPVIAFIPGWSMPARLWRAQLAELGRRSRVAALDPRGQGESALPDSGFDIDRRAEDLHEFFSRYRRVVVVAWSLGALETLQYLSKHGHSRVAALVIVDSSVGEGPAQAPRPPGTGFIDELRRNRESAVESFVRAIFRQPMAESELLALRDEALRMPLEASVALFPRTIPREHWRRVVHEFRKPLLYVVTPQFSRQATHLRKNRAGTHVAVFRDAGHALFVDEPKRFNMLLSDFLRANGLLPRLVRQKPLSASEAASR